jgi:hypothetical protein
MFFSVFWTAYIPVTLIILSLVGGRLKQFFRESRAHAWVYRFGPAAREAQSLIEDGRSGSEAIATTAALAANRHRESQGKMLPAAAISRKRPA